MIYLTRIAVLHRLRRGIPCPVSRWTARSGCCGGESTKPWITRISWRRELKSLRAEVESLDQQADEALSQNLEEAARRALRDLQVAQQRLTMAEADLRDHRSVTEDLMLRVNELDAAAADLRHAQADPASEGDVMQQASQAMGEVLQQMRERIAHFSAMEESAAEVNPAVDETAIDDDLARRVERLSKK